MQVCLRTLSCMGKTAIMYPIREGMRMYLKIDMF